jgi:hypothetical protein
MPRPAPRRPPNRIPDAFANWYRSRHGMEFDRSLVGTKDEVIWDCEGTARGYPMQSYRAEGYGRMSLLLFLTHFIRHYGIKTADDLCVTPYCDNSSLLETEE